MVIIQQIIQPTRGSERFFFGGNKKKCTFALAFRNE